MTTRAERTRAASVAVLGAVLALGAAGLVAWRASGGWQPSLELWLARGTGWSALGALALALSATPIARLARRLPRGRAVVRWAPPLRRAFGISAATLAILHAAVSLSGWLDGAWPAVLTWPYLRAGLVALLVLIPLLVTSFPPVVRRLRVRLWKPLHRLAYVAAALVFLHLVLSPFAPRALVLAVFGALAVVGLLRLVPPPRDEG